MVAEAEEAGLPAATEPFCAATEAGLPVATEAGLPVATELCCAAGCAVPGRPRHMGNSGLHFEC